MSQLDSGYFRNPTVCQNQVVFVCEDDLWSISLEGGRALRLTNSRGNITSPHFSPDGHWIACCAQEEGQGDVYLLPAVGGPLRRLTFLNAQIHVVGWTPDGQHIIFESRHQRIHDNMHGQLYTVSCEGGPIQNLPYGPAVQISYGPDQAGIVLGRNIAQNHNWKRYRGGCTGEIWIRQKGKRQFVQILQEVKGNPICPMWIGQRIYFVSDHDGTGNLYSCDLQGNDLQQHTTHTQFYVRSPSTDGSTIVFHAGGDLYAWNPTTQASQTIPIEWYSPRTQLQRKFFYGDEYVDDAVLHPEGHMVAVTARGHLFSMPLWEQAVVQHGRGSGVRRRLVQWLADGRLVTIWDENQDKEKLAIFSPLPQQHPEATLPLPPGRIQTMVSSPEKSQLALTTNRMALYLLDIGTKEMVSLDSSPIREIEDVTFSPDGQWLAYTKYLTLELTAIFLAHLETGDIHQVTQPIRYDFAPAFDPLGKYLYFLSVRTYNPISDTVQVGVAFSRSVKPYLLTLKKDTPNPFWPKPHAPGKQKDDEGDQEAENKDESTSPQKEENQSTEGQSDTKETEQKRNEKDTPRGITIDLEGIQDRMVEFPVGEGLYQQIIGLPNKAMFTEFPLEGELEFHDVDAEDDGGGLLWSYDFEKQELEELADRVSWMQVNPSAHTMLYFSEHRIRVVEAGAPVPDELDGPQGMSRKTGWLDLSRIRISVDYAAEWQQMFREAWRLQKEFFWRKDLSGIDWDQIYERYAPLVKRVGSRSELSDVIWEMQGELGTSHTYEFGGDYHPSPMYWVGKLGVDWIYDKRRKCYMFHRIYQGDVWKKNEHSPLCEPGYQVKEGDCLVAIGGVAVNEQTPPEQLLVHQAGQEVVLSIKTPEKKAEVRHVVVKTMIQDQGARYREWINANKQFVAVQTEGQVGYLHIPDMQAHGIAEFHRGFLAQTDKAGLIIDVRYNAGGMISPLILEKLSHRHLGYDVPRWGIPEPYPYHTLRGHVMVLANEFTGSDGDMFCQSFKTLKLGKVIGKRTWGGVIGADARYHLVDDTVTTQPQYSAWFPNEEYSLENYGVEPDVYVEFPPHAYSSNRDPQLERCIQEMLQLLKEKPVPTIEFDPVTRQRT